MERCHPCNRQFGLIRHRWWGYYFCTKTCLNDFLVKRTQQLVRMKEWLGSPDRDSPLPFMNRLNRDGMVGKKSIFPNV
jgi:hypothetical protein